MTTQINKTQHHFTPAPPQLATIQDVAIWLGITQRTVYYYLTDTKINFPKPIQGLGVPRWHWETLLAWARAGGGGQAPCSHRGRPRKGDRK